METMPECECERALEFSQKQEYRDIRFISENKKRSFSYIGSNYIALLSLDYLWELHGPAINSGNIFYPKKKKKIVWVFIKHYKIFVGIYELLHFMSDKKKNVFLYDHIALF